MNKLLYIFLGLSLILACSDDGDNDSNEPDSNNGEPSEIKFTLEEVWQDKLTFSSANNRQVDCDDEVDYIAISGVQGSTQYYAGLAGTGVVRGNHYSVDTIVLNLNVQTQSWIDNKGFDLGPLSSHTGGSTLGYKQNPQYIGHIELIGFNEESKLFLSPGKLEYASSFNSTESSMNNKIQYFSSNVSEEFLNSITYKKYNLSCPVENANYFVKSNLEINNLKIREHTLPFNLTNDGIEIGVLLGIDNGTVMEGISNGLDYLVVGKEYIY